MPPSVDHQQMRRTASPLFFSVGRLDCLFMSKPKQFQELATLLLGSFAIVTALAWNSAIESLIEVVYPLDFSSTKTSTGENPKAPSAPTTTTSGRMHNMHEAVCCCPTTDPGHPTAYQLRSLRGRQCLHKWIYAVFVTLLMGLVFAMAKRLGLTKSDALQLASAVQM